LNHGSSIRTVWIIGPPCAGKTTLARLLVARLRENGRAAMLLDGDEIRAVFENQLGFDPASRRKQTARVLRLARWVIRQDIIPVVAIIHPFADDRAMCRDSVPGYFEVYLKCDMKERIRRDTKKLYLPAIAGEKRHVVGVDIPYEEPPTTDLILESDRGTPDQLLDVLWPRIR
jgi:adenylylsulfate kinase-like enzyme